MQTLNCRLKYFFIYDPSKQPLGEHPSVEEEIDAKISFFYPQLSEKQLQRNIVSFSEGFSLFFNSFQPLKKPGSDEERTELSYFLMSDYLIIQNSFGESNKLVIVLQHKFYQKFILDFAREFVEAFMNDLIYKMKIFAGSIFIAPSEIENLVHFVEAYFCCNQEPFAINIVNYSFDKVLRSATRNLDIFSQSAIETELLKNEFEEVKEILVFEDRNLLYSTAADNLNALFAN